MKYTCYLQTLAASASIAAIPAFSPAALADDDERKTGRISVQQADGKNVEIEIEPGGFFIESDGDVVEFHTGDSSKKKMSLNLNDMFGQNSSALGEIISDLVKAHPEQAGKLAQQFLSGDLLDIVEAKGSTFAELFAAGIEEASPYYIGVEVEIPGDAILSQLNLTKGTALVVRKVVVDSPAEAAGFQKHDVIISRDGTSLGSREDLVALVTNAGKAEKPVDLTRISGGKKQEVSLVPAKRKPNAFGAAAFFGQGVVVPEVAEAIHIQEANAEVQEELKAVREELDEQRKMLESILSKLSETGDNE